MQLNQRRRSSQPRNGTLTQALRLATVGLFATAGFDAQAQMLQTQAPMKPAQTTTEDPVDDLGKVRVETGILFYQETGGRVQATEPVIAMTLNHRSGDVLSLKLTADTLTGATPNGAAPWNAPQTFTTPTKTSVSTTSTSASGNSTISTVNGIAVRNYSAVAHALPLDYGFNDERYAFDVNYSQLVRPDIRLNYGGSYSTEHDYVSKSLSFGVSKDFNDKNTTVSLSVNGEFDDSQPYFGTPTPFTVMNGEQKGGNRTKTVVDVVLGVTQVVNRYWLMQLNYNFSNNDGYQTDPYRILSVVDPTSGAPQQYLYENRPNTRQRQSLYFGNKLALGPTVTDLSGRYYHDSWGITSYTAELAERVPIVSWLYIEPFARYYHQTKANFFVNYLVGGAALPAFATSDSRLGQFDATTFGLNAGFKVSKTGQITLRGTYYSQTGNGHPADAIGALKNENLFSGIKAYSAFVGYSFAFQ